MKAVERQLVMWAEQSPNIYSGDSCDEHRPQWIGGADGDKDSEGPLGEPEGALALDPKDFPAGTRVQVWIPVCPNEQCGLCQELCECAGLTGRNGLKMSTAENRLKVKSLPRCKAEAAFLKWRAEMAASLLRARFDSRERRRISKLPPKGLIGSEFWPDGPECLCYPEAPGCLGPPCLTVPHREGLVWGTKRPYLQLRRHILHTHLLRHGPSTLKLFKRLSDEEKEHVPYHGLMQDLDVVGIRVYEAPRTWKAKPGCLCGVSYRDLVRWSSEEV